MRFSFRRRVIEPELLDTLAPGEGRNSVADLTRINRRWGGYSSLRKLIDRVSRADERFSLLDVGAASGDMGREIARVRPGARVVLLDRLAHHLEGADAPRTVADACALPFADGAFDFVFSSLFLHHFSEEEIVALLREFRRVARRAVLAVDLERRLLAYYFLPATKRALGWDAITVHDGPISVAAGFRRGELARLADRAGLIEPEEQTHGLAFRITLSAQARSRLSR